MAVAMIVMEPGSQWPGPVGDAETLVVLRSDRDPVASTRQRLAALERARQHVSVAVLACSGATDAAATGQRAAVADELLAAVSRVFWGKLILTSSGTGESRRGSQQLLALAEKLLARLEGTSATVSLRFTESPPLAAAPAGRP